MKAIETTYKGYRFRSRTEARWAVYFDALGVNWEYEKEGFVMPDGTWYLPDFYLPDHKAWVEVKGQCCTTEEYEKCRQLNIGSGQPVIMLIGSPEIFSDKVIFAPEAFIDGEPGNGVVIMPEYSQYFPFYFTSCIDPDYFTEHRDAVIAARSARFEHGEKGGVHA